MSNEYTKNMYKGAHHATDCGLCIQYKTVKTSRLTVKKTPKMYSERKRKNTKNNDILKSKMH